MESLSPFLSRRLHAWLATESGETLQPGCIQEQAVVLFADITGFTPLTERLSQEGANGVDRLSSCLNQYFSQIIDRIYEYEGDVVSFAGDALIAAWPIADQANTHAIVQQSTACAIAIRNALSEFVTEDGERLTLKLCIGLGPVMFMSVGGRLDRWLFLSAGSLLGRLDNILVHAREHDLIADEAIWKIVGPNAQGVPVSENAHRVQEITYDFQANDFAPILTLPIAEHAACFVPRAVAHFLQAGQADWLSELRRISVLFIKIHDMELLEPRELASFQECVQKLQQAIYRYEGSVYQLLVDEKGTLLIASFGLPPLVHEDDTTRAVRAAIHVVEVLKPLGIRASVGVATGHVFCGPIGNARRKDYAMVGDTMNLAARLMNASTDGILCDENTFHATSNGFDYETRPQFHLKGKAESVTVYRPLRARTVLFTNQSPLRGREKERALLDQKFNRLSSGDAGVLFFVGEAGIGKSKLLTYAAEQATARKFSILTCASDRAENATPYHAWRSAIIHALGAEQFASDADALRLYVNDWLQRNPEWANHAPLLNSVLSVVLPENVHTRHLTAELRAENLHRYVLNLLQAKLPDAPVLLILEDAHWLDSASWSLLQFVFRELDSVLLLGTHRPFEEAEPAEYASLCHSQNAEVRTLLSLDRKAIEAIVGFRVGAAQLEDDVLDFILEKAEGHPYFSEELASALIDDGVVEVERRLCRRAAGTQRLDKIAFPDSIEGLLTSRLSQLSAPELLCVKVASVIGRIFPFRTLESVYPVEQDRASLADYMLRLEEKNIIFQSSPSPALAYSFTHALMQEAVYGLLVGKQRVSLHRAVAEWLETEHQDDLQPYLPRLARHWEEAGENEKALHYYEEAAELATDRYANREATTFLARIESLSEHAAPTDSKAAEANFRQGHIERLWGEALYGLGDMEESRDHFRKALRHLGTPEPENKFRLASGLLAHVLQELATNIIPSRRALKDPAKARRVGEATRAYFRLTLVHYFLGDYLPLVRANFVALRLARLSRNEPGIAPVLSNLYPHVGGVFGSVFRLKRLARTYFSTGETLADQADHVPAKAYALQLRGGYEYGIGDDFELANELAMRCMELYRQLGDQRRTEESLQIIGSTNLCMGHFDKAIQHGQAQAESARRREDKHFVTVALASQANALVETGRLTEALTLIEEALSLSKVDDEFPEMILARAIHLKIAWLRGNEKQVRELLEYTRRYLDFGVTNNTTVRAFTLIADTAILFWESHGSESSPEGDEVRQFAEACLKKAKRQDVMFGGGLRVPLLICEGNRSAILGKHKAAMRQLRKALKTAQDTKMYFLEAQAHWEIGRHAIDPKVRLHHLEAARDQFSEMEALSQLRLVENALNEATPN